MNIHQPTPISGLNSKVQTGITAVEFAGRPLYRELANIEICASINFINCRNRSEEFNGNVESIRNSIDSFDIPNISESNAVAITLQVNETKNSLQNESAISDITEILTYHLFERIRQQLPKIPNQLLTTEFSAAILCIPHESFMELLNKGEISSEVINDVMCVRSNNLYKYMKKVDKMREKVLTDLFQTGY